MSLKKLAGSVAFCFALQSVGAAVAMPGGAAPSMVMAHDAQRGIIYLPEGGSVLRYHIASQSFLLPIHIGGSVGGVRLSADGRTLTALDRSVRARGGRSHRVDLTRLGLDAAPPLLAGDLVTHSLDGAPSTIRLRGGRNGEPLEYSITVPPRHGTVRLSGASATYVPSEGFAGVDSYTYSVRRGPDIAEAVVAVTTIREEAPPADSVRH